MMNACPTQRLSLPSALFYHPTCGYFHPVGIYYIMWHAGIKGQQSLGFTSLHDGIHKKAACVTLHFGVGQFRISNINDGLSQLNGRGHGDTFLGQCGLNVAVIKMWNKGSTEPIGDMGDEKATFPIAFKTTLAISILALGIGKVHNAPCSHLYSLHTGYQIFHLRTVCTNVLYSTSPHFARNKRQVFGSIQAIGHALSHHLVPHQPRTATQQHVFFAVIVLFHAHNV